MYGKRSLLHRTQLRRSHRRRDFWPFWPHGVFPRLIGVTHTRCHVILYETLLILGGTAGNLMDLFHLPLAGAGTAFLALWGLARECSWGAW